MSITVIPKAGEVFHGDDGSVSVILPDRCDPDYEPSPEELEDYAEWLGVNLQEEQHFMWIVREGLRTPLPEGWKACRTEDGEVYYFNFSTGESSWDHPMDEFFKHKLEEERATFASSVRGKKQTKESKTLEDRPLEKGAAGRAGDAKRVKGLALVSSSSSPALSVLPAPLPRGGRLGALGTPTAAQLNAPDVRDFVQAKSEFSLPRRTLGGIGSPVSGKATKAPEGVRELEAAIQQRIDEEIDGQRRAMRVRHEKQLTEERAALESAQQQIRSECEKAIADGKSKQVTQADIDAAQNDYEKQHNEIQMRVKELRVMLQREQTTLQTAFTQRIEEVKKEIQAEQAAAAKEQREAAAAALAKANELSAKQQEETKRESEKLVETAKNESEAEQKKRLEALRAELAKELTSAKNAAAETAAVEAAALHKAKADAATALDAIRREYSEKENELRAAKEQALLEKRAAASLRAENAKAALDAEEQRLRKATTERLTKYANETQRLVSEKEKAHCSTARIIASENQTTASTEEEKEEKQQQRYDMAARQLDMKHMEAMERIRSEHTRVLRERDLFDPRATPGFGERIRAAELAWLTENPEPRHEMPNERTQCMRMDKAVREMTAKETQTQEKRLTAVEESLAADAKVSVAAHRTRLLQEVNAQVAQYRAEQQQRVLRAQQQHQQRQKEVEEEGMDDDSDDDDDDDDDEEEENSKVKERISSTADEVSMAEAARREEELRAQLHARIDALQTAVRHARAEQEHQQKQKIKPQVLIQRPPPAPSSILSTPVMNRTLSTIPPAQSLWSSARPSPMRPIPCVSPIIQSIPQQVHLQQQQQQQQQSQEHQHQQHQQQAHELDERHQLDTHKAVYEDRLRRAALVLRGRRRELREQLVQMERAREAWLRDMNACRERHDRQHAFLLRQIKSALEKRARALNREVCEVKRASALLRERELCHQRARSPAGSGGAAVELLEGLLARTEQLESFISTGQKQRMHRESREHKEHKAHKEHKEHKEASRRVRHARSQEKMGKHRSAQSPTRWSGGDVAALPLPVWADEPEGVMRWLMEQQHSV